MVIPPPFYMYHHHETQLLPLQLSLALWECVSLEAESPLAVAAKEAVLLYRLIIVASIVMGECIRYLLGTVVLRRYGNY